MPATVTCPNCNVTLKPKTPLPAGARIKCPKCQTAFVVPGDDDAPAVAAPRPGPKSGVSKPAAPRPKPAPPPPPADEEEPEDGVEGALDAPDAPDGTDKPKKKKVPLWVWIAGGVGGLFLLCGCCGGVSWVGYSMVGGNLLGGSVSMDTYKQLKKGMTEDEVKKVMGGAPSLQQDVGGMHAETWKGSGDDFITVSFQKDKAVAALYQITNGAAKTSGGGPLP